MNQKQRDFKERLIKKRGWRCEWCHAQLATDLHHCLIGRDKRFPELDVEENFMVVCHYCHMKGEVDSTAARQAFWGTQCDRYGEEHMQNWLASLPIKIKPRFSNATEALPTAQTPAIHLQ